MARWCTVQAQDMLRVRELLRFGRGVRTMRAKHALTEEQVGGFQRDFEPLNAHDDARLTDFWTSSSLPGQGRISCPRSTWQSQGAVQECKSCFQPAKTSGQIPLLQLSLLTATQSETQRRTPPQKHVHTSQALLKVDVVCTAAGDAATLCRSFSFLILEWLLD